MEHDILSIAEAYYTAMVAKDIGGLEKYLHPNVQLIAPLATGNGKKSVLEAFTKAVSFFKTLTIRAKFASGNQAMLVYDVDLPKPIGKSSSAVLMTFQEGLIIKIELFYDARPMAQAWENHF